jgi:hypothetical protein
MSLTAGPNLPTSATGNTNTIGGGTLAWSNPTRIELADGSKVTRAFTAGGGITDDLIGTGFGFSIPAGATIIGIQLDVDEGSFGDSISSTHIRLLKAGVAAGSNKAGVPASGIEWLSGGNNVTYGGSADLWGTTWTASDINNANFGAAVVATGTGDSAICDYFKITVTYVADANVNATGVSATGSIGTAVASGTAVKAVTGVSATGSIGTVTPTVSKTVVGFSSTASLGTGTFSGTATIAVTGVSSTSHLGTTIATISVPVSGVSAAGSIGSVTATGTANINVVGISSTASLGRVRIDAVVSISGLQATASLGQVTDKLFAIVGGVSSTTHLGSVSVEVRSRMPVVLWVN